jgi:uncharacterized repeat protein (TIGR01451 family)
MKSKIAVLLLLLVVCPLALAQEEEPPVPAPDLAVTKTGPAQAAAGSDVTYTVTVTNIGEIDALVVDLTDPVPDGMSFVSANATAAPGFTCSESEGLVTCSAAVMTPGQSATFTFVFHISEEAPPATTFTNIAAGTTKGDVNDENNAGVAVTSTPPPPSADLGVTKSGPSVAEPDTDVVYTITVRNNSPNAATNVALTDTIPASTTFVSVDQPGSFDCTTPPAGAGGTVTCTTPAFAAGAVATFTLTVHVPEQTPFGTQVQNTAVVTSDNDLNEENDAGTTTLIVSTVDLSVVKVQSSPNPVNAGENVTYTITLTNEGLDPASDVTLTDVIPAGTTLVSFTFVSGTAGTCTVNGAVNCTWLVFAAGATARYTLVLRAGDTTSISNTASVMTSSPDVDPSNDSSTATTTVTPSADLAVAKSGPSAVTAGTNATYSVTVTNNGPSTATNVTLSDTLPAGTTFVSATSGCTHSAGVVTCTVPSLAPLANATFSITVLVSPTASGSITNTADVSTTTTDPVGGNNRATSTATVSASADLVVMKNGPAAVAAGTNATYMVTVTNNGPSTATNVTLTDTLPAGTTFVSATSGCTHSAGVVTCTVPSLAPLANTTFSITINVPVTATGSITNTADVSATTPDPVGANNHATSTATIGIAPADLTVTKTANAPQLFVGSTAIFTIAVHNGGPGAAENVVVTDVLPAGTTLQSAPGCTGTTTLTCNAGTLASGATVTFTVTVTLPSTPGPVVNTATVTSSTPDPAPNNNAGTATITAVVVPAGIPTLSQWGLLVLALALALVAIARR